MKGTGAKRNVCPGSCVSTGAKFPVAPVESAPMDGTVKSDRSAEVLHHFGLGRTIGFQAAVCTSGGKHPVSVFIGSLLLPTFGSKSHC